MIWRTHHGTLVGRADGGYFVNHAATEPDGYQYKAQMTAQHRSEKESFQALLGNQTTHTLSLSHVDDTGRAHYARIDRWASGKVNTEVNGARLLSHQVAPMSERLQHLIEGHSKDSAGTPWYAVLDALVEEYPEFADAVDRHAADRARN